MPGFIGAANTGNTTGTTGNNGNAGNSGISGGVSGLGGQGGLGGLGGGALGGGGLGGLGGGALGGRPNLLGGTLAGGGLGGLGGGKQFGFGGGSFVTIPSHRNPAKPILDGGPAIEKVRGLPASSSDAEPRDPAALGNRRKGHQRRRLAPRLHS
jgi:hypothetical protein